MDEFDTYLREPLLSATAYNRPIEWWLQAAQRTRFPNLVKMAINILSIPAMAVEPEQLFSEAKFIATQTRGRLSASTIKALQCLKSWNKARL